MQKNPDTDRPIVVCALSYEHRILVKSGLSDFCDLICIGPGAESVISFAEQTSESSRLIILAGLAGAVRDGFTTGRAYWCTTVINTDGRQYQSAFAGDWRSRKRDDAASRAVVATVRSSLTTSVSKQALVEAHGADLVDLESGPFALAATTLGWRWAIIRGISDGQHHSLSPDIDKWINRKGRTRLLRVLRSMLMRPWLIPSVIRLARNSNRAMNAIADELRHTLASDHQRTSTILIFGGTFDPPHRAHTTIPSGIAQQLGCNRVLYVLAAQNPLKDETPTTAEHRLEMLKIALRDMPNAEISTIELDRDGPSYTIDTLHQLRRQLGDDVSFRLLIGADQVLDFHRWKDWREILTLTSPVVMLRPPWDAVRFREALAERYTPKEVEQWMNRCVETPLIDAASTTIREAIHRGDQVVDELDPAVLQYIRSHQLYS